MAKTHIPFSEKVLAVVTPVVSQAVGDYLTANPPTGGLTIEEIKADTQIDTAIDNTHAPGSDNQDLSGKVDKITAHSLVSDTEISKIHAAGSDNQDLSGKMDVTAFSGLTKITVGSTPPTAPNIGDLYIDTN